MKFKINIRREIRIAAVLVALFGLIAFTERMKGDVTVHEIQISIENVHDNHFMDEADVMQLMGIRAKNLQGASLSQLNFSEIEQRIRQNTFVRDAQLYSDLKGNLMVRVSLRRPVARMVRNDGPDAYIAEDGAIMPVSEKFSARVLLISGAYLPQLLKLDNIYEVEEGRQIMLMINTIHEDEFWSAQVAQLDVDQKAKIVLFPQVGDETIEFGRPENLESKFKKLKIFYKEILPRVGWNKYNRINLEYEGQVVAE
jgi:cell division protein FtsQ